MSEKPKQTSPEQRDETTEKLQEESVKLRDLDPTDEDAENVKGGYPQIPLEGNR